MKVRFLPSALLAALLAAAPASHGQGSIPVDYSGILDWRILAVTGSARGLVLDDRAVVLAELDAAKGLGLGPVGQRFMDRRAEAHSVAADPLASPFDVARAIRRAARAGYTARRVLTNVTRVSIPDGGFAMPGRRIVARILGTVNQPVSATVANDGPGVAVLEDSVVVHGRRIAVRFGPDAGSATLSVKYGTATMDLRLFNMAGLSTSPGWGNSGAAPTALTYPAATVLARAGEPVDLAASVEGGHPAEFLFTVDPPLPAGLALDASTGAITGTPSAEAVLATRTITAANLHGEVSFPLDLEVSPALPAGVTALEPGFAAERWLDGLSVPVKMAVAPDGRLFFNELGTGNVRVVTAAGALLPDPFATVTVETGGERGLLGIALAPDFATSGHLFVYATVPAAGPKPIRGQVIRFTASGNAGGSPLVIVDDLPAGELHNGGDVQFAADGTLRVSVGDSDLQDSAQDPGSAGGKILRYAADGTIPADNPYPGSPEWCRGLRNTFDLCLHPGTSGLYGSENGPTFGDELNFLLPGRNYAWPSLPPGFPPHLLGPRIAQWTPVIVPTGIGFVSAANFGDAYASSLFLGSYDRVEVRRLVLSGALLTDLDYQQAFCTFVDSGVDNKPLDLVEGPGGVLFVSTFTSIWRIDRFGARNP